MKTSIEKLVADMSMGQRNSLRLAFQSPTGIHDLSLALRMERNALEPMGSLVVVSNTIQAFRDALRSN